MLGIAFQGWQTIGWKGPLSSKYFFIRDRKALITVPASMLALFVIGNFLGVEAFYTWLAEGPRVPTVFETSALLGALLWVNLGFLATRLFHRIYFTSSLYGALHGVLSVPRLLVSQTLNFYAAMRATAVFIDSKVTGRKIVWDKTAHTFPGGRPHVAATTTTSVVPLRKAS